VHPDLIFKGMTAADVRRAQETERTAIFFGFQNPSPIEDDIGLVEICHQLGIRFMQLTYNNQSLLATGCYEDDDTGLTRMGREVVAEMNRVGMVIDMSHSAERSTLEAIEHSTRPIAITHANPHWWHPALRNKSDTVLKALTDSGGMLGFSLYPHHLAGGSDCTLESFCQMIAEAASRYGTENLGIGSDLCQDQPDSVVTWMRVGRWTKGTDYGEGSAQNAGFPPMPEWFQNNRDFGALRDGLSAIGMTGNEIDGIMGGNWLRFYEAGFGAEAAPDA
jgi:membrane dipeptidase